MQEQPPSILIIDDNVDVSLILALNFRERGFTVWEAKDGEIGCQVALAKRPSLILCDEQMPHLDGPHTLARLKSTPQTADIPVLMIGGTGLNNEQVWKSRGASGFVPKPFQMKELLAVVEKVFAARAEGPKVIADLTTRG